MSTRPIRQLLESIAAAPVPDPDPLARLVAELRPRQGQGVISAVTAFAALVKLLENDARICAGLSIYLERLCKGLRVSPTLTDSGMPSGRFWYELRKRFIHKLLPFQPEPDTLDHVLVNVFFRERDAQWVAALPMDQCLRFMELMGARGLGERSADDPLFHDLLFAAKVLGMRLAGHAFDHEVLRMVPEQAGFGNAFVAMEDALDDWIDDLRAGKATRNVDHPLHRQVVAHIRNCHELIAAAYRNVVREGISFAADQRLIFMLRSLERLERVVQAIVLQPGTDGRPSFIDLVRDMVRFSAGRNRIVGFVDQSTQTLAREITQHTGRTGEHYITSNAAEYKAMFRSALGGGAVVAMACVLKAWYGSMDTSQFGHAVLYSLNYAMAFIGIYLLHFTLATKQPAMTAATIATTLDTGKSDGHRRYIALARLIARTCRSQLVAFAGNVLMAFPVAVLLGYAWNLLFGPDLFAHKAPKMIAELHPFTSAAIPHAAIAGVFLFLSGLIAGSITNASINRRVPLRIREHPTLKLIMRPERRARLADLYERHAGGVISNFWFGVFMGCVGVLGAFFGLPLDIRHITFAAGNLGLGMVGMAWHISVGTVLMSLLGIFLIGVFNFAVSFALSLSVALRSRGIPVSELFPIAGAVRRHFMQHPADFFLPPKA